MFFMIIIPKKTKPILTFGHKQVPPLTWATAEPTSSIKPATVVSSTNYYLKRQPVTMPASKIKVDILEKITG